MALNAYLKLTGQKQGQIKGSVTQKGKENKIMVIAVNHEVGSGSNQLSGSGRPGGKIQHKSFVITKELDKSSPLLYSALIRNEMLTEFVLEFWTPRVSAAGGAGTEVQHYTVKLSNAQIIDIRFSMLNNKNPELVKYAEYEEVSFVYEKIEWIWTAGGITAEDIIL
jgi:type VI secretion system secreted protein Hcp